jgi:CHAT domain-containing protein/tetratricopeptide (TPR) repeat protein
MKASKPMKAELKRQIEDLCLKGAELWREGKPKHATEAWADAVAKLPEDAPPELVYKAKFDLTLGLYQQGFTNAALAIYPELLRICEEEGYDPRYVLNRWANTLERDMRFGEALEILERIRPDNKTSELDRMNWNSSVGLLCWSLGRLTRAHEHLKAASSSLPSDPASAAIWMGILGNDAALSLVMDDSARAHRLVDRMVEIRQAVKTTSMVNEIILFQARASLLAYRKDFEGAAKILKEGLDWITQSEPDEWLHKLEMLAQYATTVRRAGDSRVAIAALSEACKAAPSNMRWVGQFTLAELQIQSENYKAARQTISELLASVIGNGPAERDSEFIALIAILANGVGARSAAAFLGKLTLKYMIQVAGDFEWRAFQVLLEKSALLIEQTIANLNGAGRFQEAATIADLMARVRRYVLYLQRTGKQATNFQPVPFDAAEMRAEAQYLVWRQDVLALREAGRHEEALERAEQVLTTLLAFETQSGLERRTSIVPPPGPGVIRMSLVAAGDCCEVRYLWSDRTKMERIEVAPSVFFARIAALRETTSDLFEWREPAKDLWDWLVAPIAAELQSADCLEIDASGALGKIPMVILMDGNACLIQKIPIRYVLNVDTPQSIAGEGIGIAHFSPFETGGLAAVPSPLRQGAALFDHITAFIGQDFTRDALAETCLQRPAFLSIATHLESEPARPDQSSLQLGGDMPLLLTDFGSAHFDLVGVRIALFATCASGVDDETAEEHFSLASIVLEKGARHFVGTLWPITQTAAADFVVDFWHAVGLNQNEDPASTLAKLQSQQASEMLAQVETSGWTGGIGTSSLAYAPEHWAGFAVFTPCNPLQPRVDVAPQSI